MTEYEVTDYADLSGAKLSDAGRDRVLAAMANGYEAVLWLEEWLLDEKGLEPLSGSARLVGLRSVEAESEKAWLVTQGETEEWVPKSQAELYRAGDGEIDTEGTPQAFLGDYDA